jgi:hypothetical protein
LELTHTIEIEYCEDSDGDVNGYEDENADANANGYENVNSGGDVLS